MTPTPETIYSSVTNSSPRTKLNTFITNDPPSSLLFQQPFVLFYLRENLNLSPQAYFAYHLKIHLDAKSG